MHTGPDYGDGPVGVDGEGVVEVVGGRVVSTALSDSTGCRGEQKTVVSESAKADFGPLLPRFQSPFRDDLGNRTEAVHGIPGPRRLRDGDLVKLDVTVEKDGYMADAAITVPVGRVTEDGGFAAHYEHTIVITRGRPILLTAA